MWAFTMMRLVDLYDLWPEVQKLIDAESDKRRAKAILDSNNSITDVNNRYDKQLQKRYGSWSI